MTKPSDDRLSKQMVYGFKSAVKNTKVNGYEKSSGNKRFNLGSQTWKNVTNNSYVKNEFNLRLKNSKIYQRILTSQTLYTVQTQAKHVGR